MRLPETAATGYRWSIDRIDGATSEGDSYDLGTNMQPGAGGTREFHFRVTGPVKGRLELKHWRDWEGESSVTERFAADVTVAD